MCRRKWDGYMRNCRNRGLGHLTYEQWLAKLDEAGITFEQVGRTVGSYCLARYTDSGDYTPDSCRFVPLAVNFEDRHKNGITEAIAQKLRGRTKFTHESVAKRAAKILGRTAESHPEFTARAEKAASKMRGRTKHTHAGHASTAEKTSCDFSFRDPSGVVHSGRGLNDFAKANGLLANALSKLRHGRLKAYKGWTLA